MIYEGPAKYKTSNQVGADEQRDIFPAVRLLIKSVTFKDLSAIVLSASLYSQEHFAYWKGIC